MAVQRQVATYWRTLEKKKEYQEDEHSEMFRDTTPMLRDYREKDEEENAQSNNHVDVERHRRTP